MVKRFVSVFEGYSCGICKAFSQRLPGLKVSVYSAFLRGIVAV